MTTTELTAKINDGLTAKGYSTITAKGWEKIGSGPNGITRRVYLTRSNGKSAGMINVETLELKDIDGAILKRDLKQILGV